jgi:hypothetical protein
MSAYEKAMATRKEWERLTEGTRRTALAADLELQRRHPREQREPLRSAEPVSEMQRVRARGQAEPVHDTQPALDGTPAPTAAPEPDDSRQQDARMREALGLTPQAAREPSPEHAGRVAENARRTQEILDWMRTMPEPAEDPDLAPSEAWATVTERQRESVLQASDPHVTPAPQVTEPQADTGPEAAE